MREVWVAELLISERTREKISSKHGIDVETVRRAVVCVAHLLYVWDDDPDRGSRVIVETRLDNRRVLVVLYPASESDPDLWNLGSVYPA